MASLFISRTPGHQAAPSPWILSGFWFQPGYPEFTDWPCCLESFSALGVAVYPLTPHPHHEPQPGVGTLPCECSQTQAARLEPWVWTGSAGWGEDWLGPGWAERQCPRESGGCQPPAFSSCGCRGSAVCLPRTWPTTQGLDGLRPGVSWALQSGPRLCVLLQLLVALPAGSVSWQALSLLEAPTHPGPWPSCSSEAACFVFRCL